MKKVFKLLSVFLLSAAVSLTSCEGPVGPQGDQGSQGAQGPQGGQGIAGAVGPAGAIGTQGTAGTNGTNGKDGNANVTSKEVSVSPADWKQVQIAGIGTNTSSTWGGVLVSDAMITADKTVQAFVKLGTKWQALPIEFIKDGDGSKEYMSFGYQTGSVQFNYRQVALNGTRTYAPTNSVDVKYITIQQTFGQAMQNAGVNMRNYNEVVDYINTHGGQL
ncbi:MAG: hypothetical protein ACI9V1_000191 [Spirosomataceae bacterium]|jgi:hypothetical protein